MHSTQWTQARVPVPHHLPPMLGIGFRSGGFTPPFSRRLYAAIWRGELAATPPRLVIWPRVQSGFRMAIQRGCSDRWRGGTGTLACALCISEVAQSLAVQRLCATPPHHWVHDGLALAVVYCEHAKKSGMWLISH